MNSTLVDVPTLIVNVLTLAAVIATHLPLIGSEGRGYVWTDALLSIAHLNPIERSLILIKSPITNGWPAIVITILPVLGVYATLSAVCSVAACKLWFPTVNTNSPVSET